MPSPLVGTKLVVPPLRNTFVPRPRVGSRLGHHSRLVVVSAPAGFGKTTALAAWVTHARSTGRSVAWVSCEAGEQQASAFWTYVLTSIGQVEPQVGGGALALVGSGQGSVDAAITLLLNDLAALPHELDLVLDDYHLAESHEVAQSMRSVLDHLPPQVRVLIGTRVDPNLPLAGLRARGELHEVRARDLRFTLEEVTTYLRDTGRLTLAAEDVAVLEQRTEGWIAALQLAALSMEGRDDPGAFVAGFAGDDRYIVDYLVDEVLSRQSVDVRDFLLRTSVLDRLSGALCDAVTGGSGGRQMLESLERANLFVVPLDDTRQWYRYHHLFADVLQTHLREELPGEVATLHRRASDWYDTAGEAEPAVLHAIAAGDVGRAAELVELAIPHERRERREATVVGWLDLIPQDVVRQRPVLAMGFVSGLMAGNDFATVPARLDEVERVLASGAATTVADAVEMARLPAAIQLYRGALALVAGDREATHRHAALAVERAQADDDVTRASAAALSALAHWGAGDLEAAHRGYAVSSEGLERAGHLSDVLGCTITLAEIRLAQGRLGEATAAYQRALGLAERQPQVLRGTADMHVGLSQLALARGDLSLATHHLEAAGSLGEGAGLPQHPYRSRVAAAGILEAHGDLAGAALRLAEAEQVYVGDFNPDVRPVAAQRARVLLAAGRLADAVAWAGLRGLSPDDEVTYLREYEHLVLARVLLAQASVDGSPERAAARGLLERLLRAAEVGQRVGSEIEVRVVQASALATDDPYAASSTLARALTLGEPEGQVWVFAREGQALVPPLRAVLRERPTWDYARGVLAAAGGDPGSHGDTTATRVTPVGVVPAGVASDRVAHPGAGQDGGDARQGVVSRGRLVEPLSRRERDILRLLATDLSGPEIARELVVSLNTVRTHTRNVYAKLGVSNRRAAVRRAGELGLLSGRR
jgi:LuxR family maltose regulon positive regulatory protein